MTLSTNSLKIQLLNKYSNIKADSLKRVNKSKNQQGQIVRMVSSNIGQILVISDETDNEIVDISLNETILTEGSVKANEFTKYYFAVGDKVEYDSFCKINYVEVAIVPKKYWDQNKFLYDQPLKIEDLLAQHKIESPNETSSFQAFNYPTHLSVLLFLESLGMEYKNDISLFLISTGQPMYIKP